MRSCILAKQGCSHHPMCCCIMCLQSWSLICSLYGACWSCYLTFLMVVRQHIAFACRMPMPSERNYNIILYSQLKRMLWPWFSKLIYSANTFLDVTLPCSLTISLVVHLSLRNGIPLLAATRLQHWAITMRWSSSSHIIMPILMVCCGFLCSRI